MNYKAVTYHITEQGGDFLTFFFLGNEPLPTYTNRSLTEEGAKEKAIEVTLDIEESFSNKHPATMQDVKDLIEENEEGFFTEGDLERRMEGLLSEEDLKDLISRDELKESVLDILEEDTSPFSKVCSDIEELESDLGSISSSIEDNVREIKGGMSQQSDLFNLELDRLRVKVREQEDLLDEYSNADDMGRDALRVRIEKLEALASKPWYSRIFN